ncbi:hypothetical protein [Escherichia coli]|nr:hypothetical protein [Escherichia coli]
MPIIDLNQLPAPDVVEELDFETILAERKATLKPASTTTPASHFR